MAFLSDRLASIKPSPTFAIAAQAAALRAQGKDIISLSTGEPDFDTPLFIKQAAIRALEEGKTKYTAVEGILPLRQAIAKKFKEENGIDYTPEQIIVSSGAKQVIFNAFLASLNLGDEVVIPAPYWVSYPEMVEIAGGVPVIVTCEQTSHFKLTPEQLERHLTAKTKWLILNSPNNPTGMVYTARELECLASVLRKYPSVHVLTDDIYEHLVYDNAKFATLAHIAPDLKERILTVNGVSKSYSMTGWRVGYGAGPLDLIKAMATLQSQSTTNACSIAQEATVTALREPATFREEWVKVFAERRNAALKIFSAVPELACFTPEGAFFLFIGCADVMNKVTPLGKEIETDLDFASYLLGSVGVAVVPGTVFGLSPYFRVSYATATDLLLEGSHRIVTAIKSLS